MLGVVAAGLLLKGVTDGLIDGAATGGDTTVLANCDRLGRAGVRYVCSFIASIERLGLFSGSGTGTLKAAARAVVIEDALGKRAAGFFASPRMMTAARAGEMFGLMRAGEVGIALTCCIMTAAGLSP